MYTLSKVKKYKNELLRMRKEIRDKLKRYPEGEIVVYPYKKNGRHYSSIRVRSSDSKTMKTITKDTDAVQRFSEKAFYQKKLDRVEYNLKHADLLLENFMDISTEAVLEDLPEELHSHLPFSESYSYELPADPALAERMIEWMNIPCPPSIFHPEELKHKTTAGFYVRSKSEALWTEKLVHYKAAFKFELPLQIDIETFAPDFTVMRKDGKIIYVEHCGLMERERYMRRFQHKLFAYKSAGIVPWDNLILTYDDPQGRIDVSLIEAQIKSRILIGENIAW